MKTRAFFIGKNQRDENRWGSLRPRRVYLDNDIRLAVEKSGQDDLWILSGREEVKKLAKAIDWPANHSLGNLVVLCDLHSPVLEALSSRFQHVVFASNKRAILPSEQLGEVLHAENRRDLAIAGAVDPETDTVVVWRGNFSKVVVPKSWFAPSGTNPKPDFDKFSIIDYGQTLKFGVYEAAFDALLYECDPDYRRRLNQKRRAEDQGFGASLRRLRIQKKLRRTDFAPLSEKTVARIERGKVSISMPTRCVRLGKNLVSMRRR